MLWQEALISEDQSLFDNSFNDPYKPVKPSKGDSFYPSKKRPLESDLEEPSAKRPFVPSNDFQERSSPSPAPQGLAHERRVIVPAGKCQAFLSVFHFKKTTICHQWATPSAWIFMREELTHPLLETRMNFSRLGLSPPHIYSSHFTSSLNKGAEKTRRSLQNLWPLPIPGIWLRADLLGLRIFYKNFALSCS